MTKDEALKLALEALKEDRAWLETDAPTEVWEKNNEAITAIKAALLSRSDGEAKDEPVQNQLMALIDENQRLRAELKFNTTPPQRKPLTDEEMQRIIHEHTKLNPNQRDDKQLIGYIINATRAIEAAHGIKGEA